MVIAASVANFKLLTFNYGWFKHPCLFVVAGLSYLYNQTLTSIHDYWKNHRKSPQLRTELLPPRICLCAGTAASQKTGQSSRAPRALARAATTPPPSQRRLMTQRNQRGACAGALGGSLGFYVIAGATPRGTEWGPVLLRRRGGGTGRENASGGDGGKFL